MLWLVCRAVRNDAGLGEESLSILVRRRDHGCLLRASEVLVTHMPIVINFAWTSGGAFLAQYFSEVSNGLALAEPGQCPHAATRGYPLMNW